MEEYEFKYHLASPNGEYIEIEGPVVINRNPQLSLRLRLSDKNTGLLKRYSKTYQAKTGNEAAQIISELSRKVLDQIVNDERLDAACNIRIIGNVNEEIIE